MTESAGYARALAELFLCVPAAPCGVDSQTFPSDQCPEPNLVALRGLVLPWSGAGDGNRTHTGGASEA
jgi:hypothetical protein